MEFNFTFESDIRQMIDDNVFQLFNHSIEDINNIRGISINSLQKIYINLTAVQYKQLKEYILIHQLSSTIVHEYIHLLIYGVTGEDSLGDEKICLIMAGQS